MTDAAKHDSRAVPQVLDASNAGPEVYADAAYGTPEVLRRLACGGFEDRLAQQGRKNRPLTPEQRQRNRLLTRTRAGVEHVFAAQWQLAQTLLVRTIGLGPGDRKDRTAKPDLQHATLCPAAAADIAAKSTNTGSHLNRLASPQATRTSPAPGTLNTTADRQRSGGRQAPTEPNRFTRHAKMI